MILIERAGPQAENVQAILTVSEIFDSWVSFQSFSLSVFQTPSSGTPLHLHRITQRLKNVP